MKITVDGNSLTVEEVQEVASNRVTVAISREALGRVRRCREYVNEIVARGDTVYGITTGFGKFCQTSIGREQLARLQRNLIVSHAAGVGPALPIQEVRAAMLLRANVLAKGYSGVRPLVVETLVEMLNRGVHPIVPAKGSVGASGDLAPLAHIGLVLLGLGHACYGGERLSGGEAMERAGLNVLHLEAKEGLALTNGTQVMTGIGCLALMRAERLATAADIIGAMSLEALLGTPVAFDERLQKARGHRGQLESAENMRTLLHGSQIVASHKECDRVQDAYSIRCMPQVHGACRDALRYVRSVLEVEINAATDNPLIFPDEKMVVSGGNFHGQPVAQAMDVLALAVSDLGNISERRTASLMSSSRSHLPPFLVEEGGVNSGFMMAQVSAAALVAENRSLAHPVSVDTVPTSADQEDHVSMGTVASRKARDVVENVETILAIELLCAAQGMDFRAPLEPGQGTKVAHGTVRAVVPFLKEDRVLSQDIDRAKEIIGDGNLLGSVENALGELK